MPRITRKSVDEKILKLKTKTDAKVRLFHAVPAPRPKIVAQKNFLTSPKKALFAIGLILPAAWKRSLGVFTLGALSIFFVFGFLSEINSAGQTSKQILGVAQAGLESLGSGDFPAARKQLLQAQNDLQNSREILVRLSRRLAVGQDMEQLLSGSARLAAAAELLSDGAAILTGAKFVWDSSASVLSPDFYAALKQSRDKFVQASLDMDAAGGSFAEFNASLLPDELLGKFQAGRDQLAAARSAVSEIIQLENFAMGLLGGEQKTYLLIFQNNNEARATGGFIGTYGLLSLGNGSMRIDKIESIYNLDGQLKELIAAPGPLQRTVSPHWGLRDANWFADFPESSRKILSFLEKESGVLASGIISFTPDVFEQLLTLTGPVPMPQYGETLTAENFRDRVQYKTSIDYNRAANQPKKFLADFAPRLLQKISGFDQTGLISSLEILARAISEKHLLMFSLDADFQQRIESYNAAGQIKQTDGDYLAIYHSNVGGGKTDQGIAQKVEHEVSVDSLGRQIVNLKITRSHQDSKEKYFPKNVDFMRILVPKGSRLISASGFDEYQLLPSTRAGASTDRDLASWDSKIQKDYKTGMYVGEESGYSSFMNWLQLDPGQTKTVTLSYELPFQSKKYTLLVQKQPGARAFEFALDVKQTSSVIYRYPENPARIVTGDHFYAVLAR